MGKTRIDTALSEATHLLSASSTPQLDAELLLAHVLNKPRSYFFTWPEALLTSEQMRQFLKLVSQRKEGRPVAYLTGQHGFWSLQLKVTEATLIPRPDTELLVELVLDLALEHESRPDSTKVSKVKVADLGTGTGAIALALAKEQPDWEVTAIDKNPEALAVATENAIINNIRNTVFVEGFWCSPLARDSMDIIVSNPPYIRNNDPHLNKGDVRYEPRSALISGADGLDDIRTIAEQSLRCLKPKGWLLLEHGYDQRNSAQNIFSLAGFTNIRTKTDLAGHDRVTLAQRCTD